MCDDAAHATPVLATQIKNCVSIECAWKFNKCGNWFSIPFSIYKHVLARIENGIEQIK